MNKFQLRECSLGSNKRSAPFALVFGQKLFHSSNNMEEKYSQNAYQIFVCHQIGKTMKTIRIPNDYASLELCSQAKMNKI